MKGANNDNRPGVVVENCRRRATKCCAAELFAGQVAALARRLAEVAVVDPRSLSSSSMVHQRNAADLRRTELELFQPDGERHKRPRGVALRRNWNFLGAA